MKNNIYTSTIIIILLLGLGIFFSLKTPPPEKNNLVSEESIEEIKEDKAALSTPVTAVRYENTKYGFSFEKPSGYTVGFLRDDLGETLLVQNAKISSGFQVYITPVDGPVVLTKEQIQADLPGTTVTNAKIIKLDNKADGLMFESSGFAGGSFEIWFAYQNTLYQVSSYKAYAGDLQKIIGTWKFSK